MGMQNGKLLLLETNPPAKGHMDSSIGQKMCQVGHVCHAKLLHTSCQI